MVLAVLQQHCGIRLHAHDVFASTVGGARLTEPATDLAVAVALASAGTGARPAPGVVAMGEIGLAGELRRVRDLPQRIAEAARLGFRVAVVPDRSRTQRRSPAGAAPSTGCACSRSPTSRSAPAGARRWRRRRRSRRQVRPSPTSSDGPPEAPSRTRRLARPRPSDGVGVRP